MAAIIATDFAYERPLYDWSVDEMIPHIQARHSDDLQASFETWHSFSNWALKILRTLPIVTFYCILSQRTRSLYYALILIVTLFFSVFLKVISHDARPFWDSDQVMTYKCTSQYGNPSGHTLAAFTFTLAPWLDFVSSFPGDGSTTFMRKPIIKVLTLIFALTTACTVAYSRLYLGRHSLDQVLYGALLGTWIAFTAHFVVREPFFDQARGLLVGHDRSFSLKLTVTLFLFFVTFTMLTLLASSVDPIANPE